MTAKNEIISIHMEMIFQNIKTLSGNNKVMSQNIEFFSFEEAETGFLTSMWCCNK